MDKILFPVNVKWSYDKEAGAWVVYSKKYGISAYGRTKKKAREMFIFEMSEFILASKPIISIPE